MPEPNATGSRSSPGGASAGRCEDNAPREKRRLERKSSTGSRFGGKGCSKFRSLDGEIQTDETFDRETIYCVGPEFHAVGFQPVIRDALDTGRKYEQGRDTIRKEWKPARQ